MTAAPGARSDGARHAGTRGSRTAVGEAGGSAGAEATTEAGSWAMTEVDSGTASPSATAPEQTAPEAKLRSPSAAELPAGPGTSGGTRRKGASRTLIRARLRRTLPGIALATVGVGVAEGVHRLLPGVPMLTAAVVLGIAAAHLPGLRGFVRERARAGLSLAGKRLMRLGIVLLGLQLSLHDVLGLGWATVLMVCGVVAVTFAGTVWCGRRLGLRGDQPLLIATGYSICGASAIGAVSEVRKSDERDVATSVALVTLCGTLAIAVLPLLQQPLGLSDVQFGRWAGAGVHDVGQVVATAQTAGGPALGDAVLVKLIRVLLLAPLVAAVALSVRKRLAAAHEPHDTDDVNGRHDADESAGHGPARQRAPAEVNRPPLVPLFVLGFAVLVAARSTGWMPEPALESASQVKEVLLAAALFGLGSAVHLPTLARTGKKVAALGLLSWVVIAGLSYAGVWATT